MRITISIFVLIGLSMIMIKSYAQNDYLKIKGLPKEIVSNKVKVVYEYKLNHKGTKNLDNQKEFNQKGLLIKEIDYTAATKTQYSYTKSNQLDSIKVLRFDNRDTSQINEELLITFKYRKDSLIKSIETITEDGYEIENCIYDEYGQLVKKIFKDKADIIIYEQEFVIDSLYNGQVKIEISDGSLNRTLFFDMNKRLIKSQWNSSIEMYCYNINNKIRMSQSISEGDFGNPDTETEIFNYNKTLLSKECFTNGTLTRVIKYIYNSKGLLEKIGVAKFPDFDVFAYSNFYEYEYY